MTNLLSQLDDDRLYSREEAAAILGMSAWTLRDMVTANTVDCIRLGARKGIRFSADNVRSIAANRMERAGSRAAAAPAADAGALRAEFAELRGLKHRTG